MPHSSLLTGSEETQLLELVQGQPETTAEFLRVLYEIKRRVADAAIADPAVAAQLAGHRARVLDVAFREDDRKTADGGAPVRLAEVGIYDYVANRMLFVVIDVRTGLVEAIEDRSGLQPPLTTGELQEAVGIARPGQSTVAVGVTAVPAPSTSREGDPRHHHRTVLLRFWEGPGSEPETTAVDLSTQEVVLSQVAGAQR
jgi:hypothetical protein